MTAKLELISEAPLPSASQLPTRLQKIPCKLGTTLFFSQRPTWPNLAVIGPTAPGVVGELIEDPTRHPPVFDRGGGSVGVEGGRARKAGKGSEPQVKNIPARACSSTQSKLQPPSVTPPHPHPNVCVTGQGANNIMHARLHTLAHTVTHPGLGTLSHYLSGQR